jgi:hypothetical protein
MVVNVALGTLSAVVYLAMRGRPGICWVILVGGVALLVTWYAARRIHDAYIRRLRDAYTLLLAET